MAINTAGASDSSSSSAVNSVMLFAMRWAARGVAGVGSGAGAAALPAEPSGRAGFGSPAPAEPACSSARQKSLMAVRASVV